MFVFLKCVGADVCGAASNRYGHSGSENHRGSAQSQHELAGSGSCEFFFYSRFEICFKEYFCVFEMRGY
jgi:hypothetical protein